MMNVFVLQHTHEDEHGNEDTKLIGVYATQTDAENAVSRVNQLPGFRNHKDGFTIDSYEINKDHWTEGFISWKEALKDSD
jgi:hypothetical protein